LWVASCWLPVDGCRLTVVGVVVGSEELRVVGCEFPVASYQLRVASCGGWVLGVKCSWLGVVGYELLVASCGCYQLRVRSCGLWVASFRLPVISYELPVVGVGCWE
jgi:hypothetical protein